MLRPWSPSDSRGDSPGRPPANSPCSVASLSLGIASIAWYWVAAVLGGLTGGTHWAVWFTLVLIWPLIGVAAVVTGFVGKRQLRASGQPGAGVALSGIIMGFIAIAAFVLYLGPFMLVEVLTHVH